MYSVNKPFSLKLCCTKLPVNMFAASKRLSTAIMSSFYSTVSGYHCRLGKGN